MPYPSEAMFKWCENVRRLWWEQRRIGQTREDGFCRCQIGHAIERATDAREQAQLCSGLFWSIWIDQVLYDVCGSRQGLYERFRWLYPFPKLYSHTGPGYASPAVLLAPPPEVPAEGPPGFPEDIDWGEAKHDEGDRYERPGRELLLEDKREFWGEVAGWLKEVGEETVRQAAQDDFRKDLGERFPPGFEFLFPA